MKGGGKKGVWAPEGRGWVAVLVIKIEPILSWPRIGPSGIRKDLFDAENRNDGICRRVEYNHRGHLFIPHAQPCGRTPAMDSDSDREVEFDRLRPSTVTGDSSRQSSPSMPRGSAAIRAEDVASHGNPSIPMGNNAAQSLIQYVEAFQRLGEMEKLYRLGEENARLEYYILTCQRLACAAIELIEEIQKIVTEMQTIIHNCIREAGEMEKRWIESLTLRAEGRGSDQGGWI